MSRVETIERTYYAFNELSDESKERAIDAHYDINTDHEWWDSVYDDTKTIAALIGIDIGDIYFSGFSSQGDGARFTGSYAYRRGALREVKEYAPIDTDLHDIARDLQDVQRLSFYQLNATCGASGRYAHSGCMSVSVEHNEYMLDVTDQQHDDVTDALRSFADWIYARLEKEYEYLTSRDCIIDSINANELEFDVNGKVA